MQYFLCFPSLLSALIHSLLVFCEWLYFGTLFWFDSNDAIFYKFFCILTLEFWNTIQKLCIGFVLFCNERQKLWKRIANSLQYTVFLKRSRSICSLCYDFRVLWPTKSTIKIHATPLGYWLLRDINWNFKWITMAQRPSSNGCKFIGGQSWQSIQILDLLGSRLHFSQLYVVNRCSPSDPGSNPGWRKLWRPTFFRLFGLESQKLFFF